MVVRTEVDDGLIRDNAWIQYCLDVDGIQGLSAALSVVPGARAEGCAFISSYRLCRSLRDC